MVPAFFTLVALSLQPAPINPGILSGKYTAGNEQIMLEVSGIDPQPGLLREVVVSNLGGGGGGCWSKGAGTISDDGTGSTHSTHAME